MEAALGLIFGILFISLVVGLAFAAAISIAVVLIAAWPVAAITHYILKGIIGGRTIVGIEWAVTIVCGAIGIFLFISFSEPRTWYGLFFLLVGALYAHYATSDAHPVRP